VIMNSRPRLPLAGLLNVRHLLAGIGHSASDIHWHSTILFA
jgi:hypothetical protein